MARTCSIDHHGFREEKGLTESLVHANRVSKSVPPAIPARHNATLSAFVDEIPETLVASLTHVRACDTPPIFVSTVMAFSELICNLSNLPFLHFPRRDWGASDNRLSSEK